MDGDGPLNAVAGPSTLPDAIVPFLPPAAPSRPPPYFKSTEDLLSKFQLLPAYDSYVRPFLPPEDMSSDKGKGKQRDMSPIPDPHSMLTNDPDDDELDRRKKKNSYKHLIKGIPGKHSTKKDDFLANVMQVPPKQRIDIVQFDSATQRDAFSVGLDGLKGWNVNTLISESPQAREDRRRKKELKKLAKSHGLGSLPQHMPTALAQTDRHGPRTTTPKPIPANPVATLQIPTTTTTNVASSERTPVDLPQKRGKKRELEESVTNVPPQQIHMQATPPASVVNGVNGIRPRPMKKQRVDIQGLSQSKDLSFQQQPTPQGV
ncbi:hypothetical protein BJ322DRAFT_1035559 [Thelephora terrestris]|uniref:Mediator of RNA polymerase II transcription subunit 19 n=1 Tax=Thelephora terrestris TaxID=56493 RepID=A0A9P6HLL4_9AGAM|nr:hypothetical protein BJ322DRAFT_1035559 [Thelephora terrestris]